MAGGLRARKASIFAQTSSRVVERLANADANCLSKKGELGI
jgi:hypothetical protein